MFDTSTATDDKIVVNNQVSRSFHVRLIGHVYCQGVKECDNPFILVDFEQMDFNWGHACDMTKMKLTMKRLHS